MPVQTIIDEMVRLNSKVEQTVFDIENKIISYDKEWLLIYALLAIAAWLSI